MPIPRHPAGTVAACVVLATGSAPSADIGVTWSGGPSGNWGLASNWTPNGVPNNGIDLYDVQIPAPALVLINGNFSIQALDLDSGASATILPGQTFTLNADSILDGILAIGTDGNTSPPRLRFDDNLAISGDGQIELRGATAIDSTAGGRLTIGSGLALTVANGTANIGEFSAPLALTNHGSILVRGRGLFNHVDGSMINTGRFAVEAGAIAEIAATSNGFTFNNSGVFEVDDANAILTFVSVANSGTFRIQNGGSLQMQGFNTAFENTGGVVHLDNGGRIIPSNIVFTGGSIEADPNQAPGLVDMTAPGAGTFTLDGATGGDYIELTNVDVRIGGTLTVRGGLDLDEANLILDSGGSTLTVAGDVQLTGTGDLQLGTTETGFPVVLNGTGLNPLLTLPAGITIRTGTTIANAPQITVDVNTAGPVVIDNANFALSSVFRTSGPLTLANNSKVTAIGARSNLSLQNNLAQLGTGAEVVGTISLSSATVSGSGKLRPVALNLSGLNTVDSFIQTGTATISATGAAVLNGTGTLLVSDGSFTGTTLDAGAPGATLTSGSDLDIEVTTGNTLTSNLPFVFQGDATISGGTFVVAGDLNNDGNIDLLDAAIVKTLPNADIGTGSTGTVNIGPDATFEATGPSTLGGSYHLSGLFRFASGGPVAVVGDIDGDGTSEILVSSGATVHFAQPVPHINKLTADGFASFDGGLATFGSATVIGVFNIAGNSQGTVGLEIFSGGTHGGAGTTTASAATVNGTIAAGRTLEVTETLTIQLPTLEGTLVNRGNAILQDVGPAINASGSGTLRNEGNIAQSSAGTTTRIHTNFVQTAPATTSVQGNMELKGNSSIAGRIDVPNGATLTFGASAENKNHDVTASIAGQGKVVIKGDAAAGHIPAVKLTGEVGLSGPNSKTEVSDGLLTLDTRSIPELGAEVAVTRGLVQFGQALAAVLSDDPLQLALLNLRASQLASEEGTEPARVASRFFLAAASSAVASTPSSLDLVDLSVTEEASIEGVLEMRRSALRLVTNAAGRLQPGARIAVGAGNNVVEVSGGTLQATGAAAGPPASTATIEAPLNVSGGKLVAEPRARLALLNDTLLTNSTVEALGGAAGGVLDFSGPVTLNNSTLISNSNPAAPGLKMANLKALQNTILNVNASGGAHIELAADALRSGVSELTINANSASQVLVNHIVNPGEDLNLNGTGTLTIGNLTQTGANIRLSPGSSAGRLNVDGNLTPGSGSEFIMEIGGTTQTTEHDFLFFPTGLLDVTHTSLRLRFINNFQNTINPADSFTLIRSAQPITGTFANVVNGRVPTADGSGSFEVSLQSGNTLIVLRNFARGISDTDEDGMPDDFEQQYFGSPTAADPTADPDGDGQTNLQEYWAGTIPVDGRSFLRIDEVRQVGDDIVIVFVVAPDRRYQLRSGSDLTAFPTLVAAITPAPTGGLRTVTDAGAGRLPRQFYHLVLLP